MNPDFAPGSLCKLCGCRIKDRGSSCSPGCPADTGTQTSEELARSSRMARVSILLDKPYAECGTRAEFLFIVLDALDQAGAPLHVQRAVRSVLLNWDSNATAAARDAFEKVTP